MLARSLTYKGTDQNYQGSAMMDVQRQGQPSNAHIDRMNPTATRVRAGLKQYPGGGHEPHFRKAPAYMKAYCHPEMDVWAPMQMTEPIRHVDRPHPGMWFGCGHFDLFKYGSPFRRLFTWSYSMWLGTAFGFGSWYRRMWLNGWEVKNQGAVDGFE
jgi:hypothetical protein